ncbi:hypothetical protein JCM10449v2_004137 [Rhodotorula kratochvilovae]
MPTPIETSADFLHDFVLLPPIPSSVPSPLPASLVAALRTYRTSVIRAFGPSPWRAERIWEEMVTQRHAAGTGAMGLSVLVSGRERAEKAARRIQRGVEGRTGYDADKLHQDAGQVLDAINTAKRVLDTRASPLSSHRSSLSSFPAAPASPSLASFRQTLLAPTSMPFPSHSAPPPAVETAYDAFRNACYRALSPAVWDEMERMRYRGRGYDEIARMWAMEAEKALRGSVHGGSEDAWVLQIEAAEREIVDELAY